MSKTRFSISLQCTVLVLKQSDVNSSTYIDFNKNDNKEDPIFAVDDYEEYWNIKRFLQNVTLQIGLKKFLWLKKVKNTVLWTYVINDLNGEEIVVIF